MRVVGVAPWISVARLKGTSLDRRPGAPRIERNVRTEPVAPIAVSGRYGDPLTIHEARLHRELCPVALQDWGRSCRVGGPTLRGAVLRLSQ